MSADASHLLALLAVRMGGAEGLPANHATAKAVKKLLDAAVKDGLLTGEQTVPTPTAKDPNKTKTIKAFALTPAGTDALAHAASHDKTVAEEAGHRAAAKGKIEAELRKQSEAVLKKIDADRDALKLKLTAALPKKAAAADPAKVQKQIDDVAKTLKGLADKIEKLQTLAAGGIDAAAVTAKFDEAFAGLTARVPAMPAPVPTPPAAPTPTAPVHAHAPAKSLADTLKTAYLDKKWTGKQGLVELPTLYERASELWPGLTVEAFHGELVRQWEQQHVELHVLNEEVTARDPAKGIRRHDKLYYYILWKTP